MKYLCIYTIGLLCNETNEYLKSQYITMKKQTIVTALLHFNVLHNTI